MIRRNGVRYSILYLCMVAVMAWGADDLSAIVEDSGVTGGLVVHAGCGDGRGTVKLGANGPWLVHGLDTDPANVEAARKYIRSRGLYGKVSVNTFDGSHLPCADNMVNLLVVEKKPDIPRREVMRVLVPEGVAYIERENQAGFEKIEKPWPDDIDEWTHYLHSADNNAVAQDTRVGPARHIQWKAKPMWCRSHEYNSSVTAIVSANGRIFYIVDNGIVGLQDKSLPARWSLVARDAFNGIKLWERPMQNWGPRVWGNVGFRSNPQVLPRRMVAIKDRIYVTFSYHGPLFILDAATGETIRKCQNTDRTYEIVAEDALVVLRVRRMPDGDKKQASWKDAREVIMALDGSGEIKWQKNVTGYMVPLSLCIADGRVCYHNYKHIVCRDLRSGKELWRSKSKTRSKPRPASAGHWHIRNPETMMVYDDTVLFTSPDGLQGYSLQSGERLWTGPKARAIAPTQPPGLFGAEGLIWPTGAPGAIRGTKVTMKGYDPQTGKQKQKVTVSHLFSPGHHVRCYRSKATERYILLPKRGVEFLDLMADNHARQDWLRAPCSYGSVPANGILYMAQHQCFCYPGVLLTGFNALTSGREYSDAQRHPPEPLLRGPAWGTQLSERTDPKHHWPTYRHDIRRSGSIKAIVPADLKQLWKTDLRGELSPPVEANGRLFVACEDTHTILCMDANTGKENWSYVAGGPIDSPPTIYRGLVLFGSTDGHVYCLRASDGELVWRFRAAPHESRVCIFGQLQSPWPVHGSVLVQDGIAYFTAGRSSFLDGGIYCYGVKPQTGKVLYQNHIKSDRPSVDKDKGYTHAMPGSRSDILVSDGTDLYLYQKRFAPDLTQKKAPLISPMLSQRHGIMGDRKMGLHLMCTKGFLDETWFNRTFWMYSRRWPGFYFAQFAPKAGQMLVFDDDTTYGLHVFRRRQGWSPIFRPSSMKYELFADANDNEPTLIDGPLTDEMSENELTGVPRGRWKTAVGVEKGVGLTRAAPPKWSVRTDLRVNAMTLAGNHLFVAGPPCDVDADDPLAGFEGRRGAIIRVINADTGKKIAEYQLDHLPDYDGMIAADGRLYLITEDDHLLCMAPR